MPLFDVRCLTCGEEWEEMKVRKAETVCPRCGYEKTFTLMPLMKRAFKAKDPYDMINDPTPGKPIKSFAKDHRKGGKDTT